MCHVIAVMGSRLVRGVASFNGTDTRGDIVISQSREPGSNVTVSGTIRGLGAGNYVLVLVSLSFGGCQEESGLVRKGELLMWDQGDEEVDMSEMHSLETDNIILDTDDVLGLVIRTCMVLDSGVDCTHMGVTRGCAPVTWSADTGVRTTLSWQIVVIIAVAIFLFFVLIIIIPLICCCIKK